MLNINFPKIDKKTFNDLEISLAEEKIKINIRGKSKDFFTKECKSSRCWLWGWFFNESFN